MKAAIAIALLAVTLTAPALAEKKLSVQNKSIGGGMEEAREKPDIARSVKKEPREDRKIERRSK
jgi:hypothetical protein